MTSCCACSGTARETPRVRAASSAFSGCTSYHPIERVDRAVGRALTHVQPTHAAVLAYVDGERRAEMPHETLEDEALRWFPNIRVDTGDVTLYDRLRRGGE